MQNNRVLITGGAGSIGSELVRQLAEKNKVFCLDFDETGFFDLYEELKMRMPIEGRVGDLRDKNTVEEVFDSFRPEIIFHAAAYKHVTPMEWFPREAVENNVIATLNLIEAAKRFKTQKFIFVSSDKAVNADSVMGVTKRLCELIVKNAGKGFGSVRFANILGSRGSVIPIWQRQMDADMPLTITDERMERYFMTIQEAASLLIQAVEIIEGGEIIVFDMGKPVKIMELAQEILQKAGKKEKVEITGIRPGEMLRERLMSEAEEAHVERNGKFWIIR